MKTLRAAGARLGGVIRAARAYYAVVPLAIPLLFLTIADRTPPPSPPSLPAKPPIDFAVLSLATSSELPEHAGYLTIESGDTLDVVLEACGLAREEANHLVTEFARSVDPRTLRPGQMLRYLRDAEGQTREVELLVRGWGSIRARRGSEDGTFSVEALEAPATTVEQSVTGEISSSLWEAILANGESPALAPKLVDVFQWDIDFFGLQKGDHFSLLVEKRFVGADFVGYGPIVAARFEHHGEVYEAFHFEQAGGTGGYYGTDGTPLRKQFLKSPLKYSRITSGFSTRRFHPVLKRFRPHYGVDYGAPTGTPVMSTADGVVTFAGRGKGEGNWIRVRHSSKIETAYLHLSRFAKGLKAGSKVRQGDVIGYVGMTGLASGPHLDYRVREGGKWINPLKLRSITPDALRGPALREFDTVVARRLPKLPSREQWAAGN